MGKHQILCNLILISYFLISLKLTIWLRMLLMSRIHKANLYYCCYYCGCAKRCSHAWHCMSPMNVRSLSNFYGNFVLLFLYINALIVQWTYVIRTSYICWNGMNYVNSIDAEDAAWCLLLYLWVAQFKCLSLFR